MMLQRCSLYRPFRLFLNALVIVSLVIPTISFSTQPGASFSPASSPVQKNPATVSEHTQFQNNILPSNVLGPQRTNAVTKNPVKEKSPVIAPLLFVENIGQFDPKLKFIIQNSSNQVAFTENGLWVSILEKSDPKTIKKNRESGSRGNKNGFDVKTERKGVHVQYLFENANPHPVIEGFNSIHSTVSYLNDAGTNSSFSSVPVWGGIRYRDFYPGIDLEVTSVQGEWNWRLVVHNDTVDKNNGGKKKVDIEGIKIKVEGGSGIEITEKGLAT